MPDKGESSVPGRALTPWDDPKAFSKPESQSGTDARPDRDEQDVILRKREFDLNKREKELEKREQELDEREQFLSDRDKVMEDIGDLEDDADVRQLLKKKRKKLIGTLITLSETSKSEKLRYECTIRLIEMDQGGKLGTRRKDEGADEVGSIYMKEDRFHA